MTPPTAELSPPYFAVHCDCYTGRVECAFSGWQVTEACWVLCDDCRRNGTRGRLGKVLERCASMHMLSLFALRPRQCAAAAL